MLVKTRKGREGFVCVCVCVCVCVLCYTDNLAQALTTHVCAVRHSAEAITTYLVYASRGGRTRPIGRRCWRTRLVLRNRVAHRGDRRAHGIVGSVGSAQSERATLAHRDVETRPIRGCCWWDCLVLARCARPDRSACPVRRVCRRGCLPLHTRDAGSDVCTGTIGCSCGCRSLVLG